MFDLMSSGFQSLNIIENLKSYGITVTLSGLIIVFSMLIILILLMIIFGAVMSRISGQPKKNKTPKIPKVKEEKKSQLHVVQEDNASDDDGVIAAISAAVMMMYECSGKTPIIRSIRPAVKSSRSAWANAGVMNNTRSF